jgi:NRAMP (natural resistance-associated macrophage protein)-like metal ion transporter
MTSRRSPLMTRILRSLGPGLLTGAADDDPSGIATYSQSGAQLGFAQCWTMFLTTPFMVAVQIVCARIGAATGQGLASNLKAVLPRPLLFAVIAVFVLANLFNIAADIAAMGEAAQIVIGGNAHLYALLLAAVCLAAQVFIPYRPYARWMKVLTLVLFAYVATAFSIHIPWSEVLSATFIPRIVWDRNFLTMLVAVLGTTISPYLFFWQASLEVEERRLLERRKEAPLKNEKSVLTRFDSIVPDTWIGMVLSNVIGFFIIVTTAATLHSHGVTDIGTAAQAAEALRPLAGPFAFLLFSLGIVGTGFLAIPALAGSIAYAVSELAAWRGSLGLKPQRARAFYGLIGASILIGTAGAMSPLNPIKMLVWSAVFNGVVAVPLMIGMMMVVTDTTIMGKFPASPLLTLFGWFATLLMGIVVVAMIATTVAG